MKYLEDLKNLLNDPKKSIRLALFNADRQANEDAFARWEEKELGCTKGMLNAYQEMVYSINEPLSIELIERIRIKLLTEAIYGNKNIVYGELNQYIPFDSKKIHMFELNPKLISQEEMNNINKDARELGELLNISEDQNLPYEYVYTRGRNMFVGSRRGDGEEHFKTLINFYNTQDKSNLSKEQIFTNILKLTRDLQRIHPYSDFNCRTFLVLILNRELIKNGFPPSIMEDPNVFNYKSLDELKDLVQEGQRNFNNLFKAGLVHDKDPTNEQWYNAIPAEAEDIKAQFHKITNNLYSSFEQNKENDLSKRTYLQKELSKINKSLSNTINRGLTRQKTASYTENIDPNNSKKSDMQIH